VILAELEVFHSRPIAPTRRVALGHRDLPCSPAPGFGGILLGGIVAAYIPALDPELDDKGSPAHHILAAVYAAGELRLGPRTRVMEAIRRAMRWTGAIDGSLVAYLSGLSRRRDWSADAFRDPVGWAIDVLDLRNGNGGRPDRKAVQGRFRDLVRRAHPDHGGDTAAAAARLAELAEARRILLAGA
jgi:hypothetical protein